MTSFQCPAPSFQFGFQLKELLAAGSWQLEAVYICP
jgi:hypothetical protein